MRVFFAQARVLIYTHYVHTLVQATLAAAVDAVSAHPGTVYAQVSYIVHSIAR